ncbi:MAG: 50S ribosomal protein L21 [Patescibacteria group bacterium]
MTEEKKITKKPAENKKFAVIETGGKQYLVEPGDKLKVEKIEKPEKGNGLVFDKVLLTIDGDDVKIGTPYLTGAKIKAEWQAEKKARKIMNMRYKSKTRQSVRRGHRQIYTEILISDF